MREDHMDDELKIIKRIEGTPIFVSDADRLEDFPDHLKERELSRERSRETISAFLGDGPRAVEVYDAPSYYGRLLAWTVKCVTTSPGWETISVHGHSFAEPIFSDIQTDYTENEGCVINGHMLLEKDNTRLVITIDGGSSIQIASGRQHHEMVKKLVQEIKEFLNEHNFYRGERISFSDRISFINVKQREWDSVILDPNIKDNIRLNTIGFLKNFTRMQEFGIPSKRGIILSGDPGTGKTVICKALMSEADNITCINAEAYVELSGEYISNLYSLAQNLSPSIIFIEDIDFLGHERRDFYHGAPPLLALLAEMDGITEKTAIVTVATSNFFEKLDKALSERPSRFDCVYRINRPDYEQRIELVKNISEKTPLSEDVMEYVAKRTNGFTPAQVQGVLHSMAISHITMEEETKQFNESDVDSAITQINIKKTEPIGFNATL